MELKAIKTISKRVFSRALVPPTSPTKKKGDNGVAAFTYRNARYYWILLVFALVVVLIFYNGPDKYKYNFDVEVEVDDLSVNNDNPLLSKDDHLPLLLSKKSHMLSLEPLQHSLHADWKLWEEMNSVDQDEAIVKVGAYMTKYGKLLGNRGNKIKHGTCELVEFASGHALCGPKPPDGCTFFSFGINDDPSFDVKLAEEWQCRGFAGDPTVHHPSKLHPLVTFHNVGASMLVANEERLNDKGGTEEWWETSMTKLRYWLGIKHVNIIKLYCEGCEFSFARDILREDPTFLYDVDQLSIETHVSKAWMTTREHFYYFGLHFALLEEAGFRLEWTDLFGCSKRHEVPGCIKELETYGFPCGYKEWKGRKNVVLGRSCQDFLWKRY